MTFNTENPLNLVFSTATAMYTIKGFTNLNKYDSLRITLQINQQITLKLDLYHYQQLEKTIEIISNKLVLNPTRIEEDLLQLTSLLEDYKSQQQELKKETIQLDKATITKCRKLLKTKQLLQNINKYIGLSGIIGEENNRLLLFIIASSYKMKYTLHGLIQGSSGSGKTRLLKTISQLMPTEDVKHYTRVTENSFYNQGEYFFVNQLICFEDMDGLKEAAQLSVRELQSNGLLLPV